MKHLQNSFWLTSSVPQRVICATVGRAESVIPPSLRYHDGKHQHSLFKRIQLIVVFIVQSTKLSSIMSKSN